MASQDQHRSDGEIGPFLFGVLLGSLIGAIAALWYSPKSGDEVRRELEQRGSTLRQQIEGESVDEAIQAGKAAARQFNQRQLPPSR